MVLGQILLMRKEALEMISKVIDNSVVDRLFREPLRRGHEGRTGKQREDCVQIALTRGFPERAAGEPHWRCWNGACSYFAFSSASTA
jgi:hypothetical protein